MQKQFVISLVVVRFVGVLVFVGPQGYIRSIQRQDVFNAGGDEAARSALSANQDVNMKMVMGDTLLIQATRAGELGSVKGLLDKNADVNGASDNGWTALMWACNM